MTRQYRKYEESLQKAVSTYLKLQYPDVYFTAESSGLRVSIGMAVKMKAQRSKHKQLDMIILEPRGLFHGLILELKNVASDVFLKNGEVKKCKHVEEQMQSVEHLISKGYKSVFVFGFDHAKQYIDWYMNLK